VNFKLRLILRDGSLIDIHVSRKIPDKFGFHWERTDGSIFRYDNFPDIHWKHITTFPFHFHKWPTG
jgi:hypothetical protein